MKATELIKKLQDLVDKHGDLQILIEQEGMGGEALFTAYVSERIDDISPYELGEINDPSIDTVKELFPNFPINEGQEFYDAMEEYNGNDSCKYIKLICVEMIYAD